MSIDKGRTEGGLIIFAKRRGLNEDEDAERGVVATVDLNVGGEVRDGGGIVLVVVGGVVEVLLESESCVNGSEEEL